MRPAARGYTRLLLLALLGPLVLLWQQLWTVPVPAPSAPLVSVLVVFRHGERAPLSSFERSPVAEDALGALTEHGCAQLRDVARSVRDMVAREALRTTVLFNVSSPHAMHVRSSAVQRCIDSARCFVDEWFARGPPAPIVHAPRKQPDALLKPQKLPMYGSAKAAVDALLAGAPPRHPCARFEWALTRAGALLGAETRPKDDAAAVGGAAALDGDDGLTYSRAMHALGHAVRVGHVPRSTEVAALLGVLADATHCVRIAQMRRRVTRCDPVPDLDMDNDGVLDAGNARELLLERVPVSARDLLSRDDTATLALAEMAGGQLARDMAAVMRRRQAGVYVYSAHDTNVLALLMLLLGGGAAPAQRRIPQPVFAANLVLLQYGDGRVHASFCGAPLALPNCSADGACREADVLRELEEHTQYRSHVVGGCTAK